MAYLSPGPYFIQWDQRGRDENNTKMYILILFISCCLELDVMASIKEAEN